ncbi:MAG TPA: hypothetical protein VHE55_12910 [Fimbriimonadaceae bacterium]|nr:hypothetical protein [Fimbriimonadaceae bacterium]
MRARLLKCVGVGLVLALGLLAFGGEKETRAAFQKALRSDPELIAFLKEMPKGADLHNHVSGAIFAENYIASAAKAGLWFDTKANAFVTDPGSDRIKASDLISMSSVGDIDSPLNVFLRTVSMRGWNPSVDGHDLFFATFSHLGAPSYTAEDALIEVIRRAKAQNEQYMELMTGVAPSSANAELVKDLPAVDDLESAFQAVEPRLAPYVAAVKANLDRRDAKLAERLGTPSPTRLASPFGIRYIIQLYRLSDDPTFFVTAAAAMAVIKADPRVVALNMVGPEDHPQSLMHFDEQMKILDFLWKRMDKPNVTLHAGELTLDASPVEPMFDRIRKSIELGHAKRIGHGISIAWEKNLPQLLEEMRDRHILVEICLTSNRGILGVYGRAHPLHLYMDAGVPVSLNTDDEGVNRSNLTMEWLRGVREQGLGYEDLKSFARNSLDYSFLPGESLYAGKGIRPGFEAVRLSGWQPTPLQKALIAANPKLQAEVNLEQASVAFEARFH